MRERTPAGRIGAPGAVGRQPAVIGHRGASGYRPEHTREAYELAFALGADSVEPDVVATRDGVLVIRHDVEISSTTDVGARPEFADRRTTKEVDGTTLTGWFVEDFTWAEIATLRARERLPLLRPRSAAFDGRSPILRLGDLFALADRCAERTRRPLGIVAEIKHATYFDALGLPLDELFAAEAARSGWLGREDLVVESFEKTVLGRLHARGFRGDRVYLLEDRGAPADRVAASGSAAADYASDLTAAGLQALTTGAAADRVEGISVELSQILVDDDGTTSTGSLPARAHENGLQIYCWTLRPENAFLPADLRIGADPAAFGDWARAFELVLRSGVDAVFADHPDLVFEAWERGGRDPRAGRVPGADPGPPAPDTFQI